MSSARARTATRVALVGVVVRLLLFFCTLSHTDRWLQGDSHDYLRLGQHLCEGAGFTLSEQPPYLPETARTPVYPAMLAGIRALFGPSPVAIALVQILLSGLFFPLYAMPWGVRWIGYCLPLTYFIQIARGVMVRGAPIGALWLPMFVLAGMAIVVFTLSTLRFRRDLAPAGAEAGA